MASAALQPCPENSLGLFLRPPLLRFSKQNRTPPPPGASDSPFPLPEQEKKSEMSTKFFSRTHAQTRGDDQQHQRRWQCESSTPAAAHWRRLPLPPKVLHPSALAALPSSAGCMEGTPGQTPGGLFSSHAGQTLQNGKDRPAAVVILAAPQLPRNPGEFQSHSKVTRK